MSELMVKIQHIITFDTKVGLLIICVINVQWELSSTNYSQDLRVYRCGSGISMMKTKTFTTK